MHFYACLGESDRIQPAAPSCVKKDPSASCPAVPHTSHSLLTSSWVPVSPRQFSAFLCEGHTLLFQSHFWQVSPRPPPSAAQVSPSQRLLRWPAGLRGPSMPLFTEGHLPTSCTHALCPVTTPAARDTGNVCDSQVVGCFFFSFFFLSHEFGHFCTS